MEQSKQNAPTNGGVYSHFGTYTTGVAAAATTAFLELASIFNEISNEFGDLFVKQAQFEQTAANASSDATIENAKDSAFSTMFNGIGSLIGAIGQFAGAAISFKAYTSALPENSNLDLAKEYQEACQTPEASLGETLPTEIEKEDFASPSEQETTETDLEKRVQELNNIKNVETDLLAGNKGPLSEKEKGAIQTMTSEEQATFKQKIDDYITQQSKAQNEVLHAAVQKAQTFNNFAQASGNSLGVFIGKPGEAAFQYKAGQEQAKVTLANAALQLAQNSAEQERNKADSFQQTAASEFDKLLQIRQAETSNQG